MFEDQGLLGLISVPNMYECRNAVHLDALGPHWLLNTRRRELNEVPSTRGVKMRYVSLRIQRHYYSLTANVPVGSRNAFSVAHILRHAGHRTSLKAGQCTMG